MSIVPAQRIVTEETSELFRLLTQETRQADRAHQTVGGGTRHWLRECFLPALERHDLAVVDLAKHITHGRHCTCRACAQEDWPRITSPCGMHGADCPAVYAPLGQAGARLLDRAGSKRGVSA